MRSLVILTMNKQSSIFNTHTSKIKKKDGWKFREPQHVFKMYTRTFLRRSKEVWRLKTKKYDK